MDFFIDCIGMCRFLSSMVLFVCMAPLTLAIISGLTFQPCAQIFSFNGLSFFVVWMKWLMHVSCVYVNLIICMERSGVGIKGPV